MNFKTLNNLPPMLDDMYDILQEGDAAEATQEMLAPLFELAEKKMGEIYMIEVALASLFKLHNLGIPGE